jgi:hypothetical protein
VWIWAGWILLGANPTSESFTVKVWLLGSQLRSAVPLGTCLRVAVAVVDLVDDVAAGVDAGAVLVLPPQAASKRIAIRLRRAGMPMARFAKGFVIMMIPFLVGASCYGVTVIVPSIYV